MPAPDARLRLLSAWRAPLVPWSAEHHNLPIGAPVGMLVCAAVIGFAVFGLVEISSRQLPIVNLGLVLAGLAAPVALAVWIGRLFWSQARAAVRSTNWIARLTESGIYLNLRSWLNWRLPAGDDSVVFVPWQAITGVHEVREEWRTAPRAGLCRGFNAFVAIALVDGTKVAELERAVAREILRVITHPDFTRGVTMWNDVPVLVGPDGGIWVNRAEMSLLRALAARVPRGPRASQQLRVGPEFPGDVLEVRPEELVSLVLRGQWAQAQQVAQFRMERGYDGSVRLIERLFAALAT